MLTRVISYDIYAWDGCAGNCYICIKRIFPMGKGDFCMLKKFIPLLFVLLLLYSGCQSKQDEHEMADDAKFDLEAKYNTLQNSLSNHSRYMMETEDSKLVFPNATKEVDKKGIPQIAGYIIDDEVQLFQKNTSSVCTLDNPNDCAGLFWNNEFISYYKGQLYYLDLNYDLDTDMWVYALMRCDIDGKNAETIDTFTSKPDEHIATSPYIQFHKNKLYLQIDDVLYCADVDSLDIQQIELTGVKGIYSIFFYGDTMYMLADTYDDGSKVHFYPILECDVDGNIKQLIYEGEYAYFIDETYIFYAGKNYDALYMLNRETKETKKLLDSDSYVLKYNDTYLLDTSGSDSSDHSEILVLNQEGEVLFEKSFSSNDEWTAQLYTGDRYYVSSNGWFGYFEINENGISDLIMLP